MWLAPTVSSGSTQVHVPPQHPLLALVLRDIMTQVARSEQPLPTLISQLLLSGIEQKAGELSPGASLGSVLGCECWRGWMRRFWVACPTSKP